MSRPYLVFALVLILLSGKVTLCQPQSQNITDPAVPWWKTAAVYQIYPRSWLDTNGDGIGDLKGIIQKLDYIKELGFEVIWISPFTRSPQRDFGYDISHYTEIAPEYGTFQDFENLLTEVHKRNMKLIFDLVMNHTSDEHPWFIESASSRVNPKKDWYIWKDGKGKKGKKRPNNWRAMAGNRAWTWHEGRKQFYYNGFLPFQPDLNYNHPEVKEAMFDVARFWLEKGVDGFRLDIISAIFEDSTLKNNPPSLRMFPSDESLTILFQNVKNNFLQPQSLDFATELRQVVDQFPNPDRFLLGESHGEETFLKQFCLHNRKDGLKAVFLFRSLTTPFKAKAFRKMTQIFEHHFSEPLLPTLVFGNHDRTRVMTRLGENSDKARLLALFQFTARGIPVTYYGEEIGMSNVFIPVKKGQDAIAIQNRKVPQFLINLSKETLNRDEVRTPMQWNRQPNAGFCSEEVKPWLPVSKNYKTINAEDQLAETNSLLNFYKKALHFRNQSAILREGNFAIPEEWNGKKVLAFVREKDGNKLLVLLNFSKKKQQVPKHNYSLLLSTHPNNPADRLLPWEGRIYRMD